MASAYARSLDSHPLERDTSGWDQLQNYEGNRGGGGEIRASSHEREAPFCSVGVRRPPSWGASGISSRLGVGSPEQGYCAPPGHGFLLW